MSLVSNLTALKNKIATLRGDNSVTPFAYDSEAYDSDDADGHADFVASRHNNIPLKDNSVIALNPFVTNKGLRDQASSFTRQLINHFCGRSSYNLNKTVDVTHALLDSLASKINQPEGIPLLDANGRISSSQLPESAVEYKGTWNAQTNTPHLANGTGDKGDMYFVSQAGEQNLWETLMWNEQRSPSVFGWIRDLVSLCYGNGIWLALDIEHDAYRSEDDFVTGSTSLSSTWTDLCFNNGRFLICSNDGYVRHSTNASNWSASRMPVNTLSCIRGDGNTVMAGGTEGIVRSTSNGGTGTFTLVSSVSVSRIFGNNGVWIACKTAGGLLLSSDNGDTWNDVSGISSDIVFVSIFCNNGKWIVTTEGHGVWESSDTTTWAMISSIPEKAVCLSVYSYDNIWVVSANGGVDETATVKGAYVSYDDTLTWSAQIVADVYNNGLKIICSNGNAWFGFAKTRSPNQATTIYKADYGTAITFLEGDEVVYNGSVWERIPVGTVKTVAGVAPVNGNVEVTGNSLRYVDDLPPSTPFASGSFDVSFRFVYYANGLFVAGSYSSTGGLWWSEDGKSWAQSNVTSGSFYDAHFANGVWVAVGSDTQYSTDGKHWTMSRSGYARGVNYYNGLWVIAVSGGIYWSETGARNSWTKGTGLPSSSTSFFGVSCANGLWVVGSEGYGLWWSEDGKQWNRGTGANNTDSYYSKASYANGLWVAGSGDVGGLWWSEDGKAWTQGTGVTTSSFDFAYYANGLWVAGGAWGAKLWWSEDGKAWTQGTVNGSCSARGIAYADGLWVVASEGQGMWWSEDGKSWTKGTGGATSNFYSVTYANNIWVVGNSNKLGIWKSEDGKAWTQGIAQLPDTIYLIAQNSGFFVAGGVNGLYWSVNSKAWSKGTGNLSSNNVRDLLYANNLWVACNSNYGGASWSTNGKSWTPATFTGDSPSVCSRVCYADGLWVIGTEYKGMWWSEDGKTWTQGTVSTAISELYPYDICYANDVWVMSANKGVYLSEDGKTWTRVALIVVSHVYYADGLWVAGGTGGLYWSEDGESWEQGENIGSINKIIYTDNLWVTCTSNGIWWSNNGKNWTQGNGGTAYEFLSVCFANNFWVAGSRQHGLWWSLDGKNWTQGTEGVTLTFHNIYYSDLWLCAGNPSIWFAPPLLTVTLAISYIKSKLGL